MVPAAQGDIHRSHRSTVVAVLGCTAAKKGCAVGASAVRPVSRRRPRRTELRRHTDLACGAMPEALQTMTAADAPWKARYRIPTYYNPTNLLSTLHAS